MINNKKKRQLNSIDWDFPVTTPGLTRTPHWYPGTFPSQLPSSFIQALTKADDIVFDPYGGIGTTAAESIRLGRRAWITDVNPIGIVASYPYSALLILKRVSPEKLNLFFEVVQNILSNIQTSSPASGGLFDFFVSDSESLELDAIFDKHLRPKTSSLAEKIRIAEPNYNDLEKWIHPKTIEEIISIRSGAKKLFPKKSSIFLSVFFEALISSNLRALSSQNKSWGHIADNVYPKELIYKDTLKNFRTWTTKLKSNIEKINVDKTLKPKGIQYWYSLHNWSDNLGPKDGPRTKPKIIVTSPPYGDAIDYIFSQKLSLYFLGYNKVDIDKLCANEFGARRRRARSDSRTRWAKEISDAAIKQGRFLDGGLFVAILPHKDHGREVGINLLTERLNDHGWEVVFNVDRSISQTRTRQSWTSIKQETITVFSKE